MHALSLYGPTEQGRVHVCHLPDAAGRGGGCTLIVMVIVIAIVVIVLVSNSNGNGNGKSTSSVMGYERDAEEVSAYHLVHAVLSCRADVMCGQCLIVVVNVDHTAT